MLPFKSHPTKYIPVRLMLVAIGLIAALGCAAPPTPKAESHPTSQAKLNSVPMPSAEATEACDCFLWYQVRIWFDDNSNRKIDADEKRLGNVVVSFSNDYAYDDALTDSNGLANLGYETNNCKCFTAKTMLKIKLPNDVRLHPNLNNTLVIDNWPEVLIPVVGADGAKPITIELELPSN